MHYFVTEQRSRTQRLAEQSHANENYAVSQRVAEAIKRRKERAILHGERLRATHYDTVCDDQAYKNRQAFGDIVGDGLQHLVDHNH
jgi:hypothetical protein